MQKNSFSYYEKIRKKCDFNSVFLNGKKISSEFFVLYLNINNLTYSRLGISIKRHISNAVKRNRMRRVIREVFRLNKNEFFVDSKYDILVVVKKDCSNMKYDLLKKDLFKDCLNL